MTPRQTMNGWRKSERRAGWSSPRTRKFHKKELEIAAIKAHSARCFYLHGGSDPVWSAFCSLVTAFPRIVKIASEVPAPFIYQVKGRRVWAVKI